MSGVLAGPEYTLSNTVFCSMGVCTETPLPGGPPRRTLLLQLCSELNIRSQVQSVGKFEFGSWSIGDIHAGGEVLPVAHG